jgi:hypothetical protein
MEKAHWIQTTGAVWGLEVLQVNGLTIKCPSLLVPRLVRVTPVQMSHHQLHCISPGPMLQVEGMGAYKGPVLVRLQGMCVQGR